MGTTGLTPAGKNFASFDRQFLKRLPRFEQVVKLSHRTIDPAILFFRLDDDRLPDSKTCYERAGLDNKVAHTAVEDALAVVRLVQLGIKRLERNVNERRFVRVSSLGAGQRRRPGPAAPELTSLVTALRKEVETRTGMVNTADTTDPAYSTPPMTWWACCNLPRPPPTAEELDKLVLSAARSSAA